MKTNPENCGITIVETAFFSGSQKQKFQTSLPETHDIEIKSFLLKYNQYNVQYYWNEQNLF